MDGILKYEINLDLKGNYLKMNDKIIDINKKTYLLHYNFYIVIHYIFLYCLYKF